jgi:hypothetical protein
MRFSTEFREFIKRLKSLSHTEARRFPRGAGSPARFPSLSFFSKKTIHFVEINKMLTAFNQPAASSPLSTYT